MKFHSTIILFFLSGFNGVTSAKQDDCLPTIVLVPGAWHAPITYSLLTSTLGKEGYEIVTAQLPSVNSSVPNEITVTTDTDFVRDQLIMPVLDQGKNILLVAHSYGGSPGAAAATGLSKEERAAAGKQGGIIGMVFIASFLSATGESLKAALGGQFNTWVIVNNATGQLGVENPGDVFYNGVPNSLAHWAISQLLPESEVALSTGPPPPAWAETAFDGCRAYIHTLLDNCIPPAEQEGILNATNVTWSITEFNTGHSPFLSEPDQLAQTIMDYSNSFLSTY